MIKTISVERKSLKTDEMTLNMMSEQLKTKNKKKGGEE